MQTVDNDMALKIYIKARATPKVVAAFAERREFDKILIYSKQVKFLVSIIPGNKQITFCVLMFSTLTLNYLILLRRLCLYSWVCAVQIASVVGIIQAKNGRPGCFLISYCKRLQVGYTPDYLFLLQSILRSDPQVQSHATTYLQSILWYVFLEVNISLFCALPVV